MARAACAGAAGCSARRGLGTATRPSPFVPGFCPGQASVRAACPGLCRRTAFDSGFRGRHISGMQPGPDFHLEDSVYARGFHAVCGVDEVGRGPLAGPVTAAAVILDPANIPPGLNDSKALNAKRRAALAEDIHRTARVSIAHASVAEIDRLNILSAALLAMERAVEGLNSADFALIDGNRIPKGLTIPAQSVVKGDARILSIAAASIVAKICRDALMVDLAQHFPGYGWEQNAGYPTHQHRSALERLGATPHHRSSFAPVHKILYQEKL